MHKVLGTLCSEMWGSCSQLTGKFHLPLFQSTLGEASPCLWHNVNCKPVCNWEQDSVCLPCIPAANKGILNFFPECISPKQQYSLYYYDYYSHHLPLDCLFCCTENLQGGPQLSFFIYVYLNVFNFNYVIIYMWMPTCTHFAWDGAQKKGIHLAASSPKNAPPWKNILVMGLQRGKKYLGLL